ncbi:MAG: dUTP diphosphatase [Rickettsiales bacterium]|mgnify:CR=1 FL=1|nr:dUTP diphosphatase [Rickettsiales bacterium]
MKVKFKKLNENAIIPQYKTSGSAGFDLNVLLNNETEIIKKGEIKLLKTGLAIALPDGYEAQIRSRSGLSLKNGIIVLNAPGTVDSDYRGEVCLIIMNCGSEDYIIENGARMAQMVIAKYEKAEIEIVNDLDSTERGDKGFGSTGVNNK